MILTFATALTKPESTIIRKMFYLFFLLLRQKTWCPKLKEESFVGFNLERFQSMADWLQAGRHSRGEAIDGKQKAASSELMMQQVTNRDSLLVPCILSRVALTPRVRRPQS